MYKIYVYVCICRYVPTTKFINILELLYLMLIINANSPPCSQRASICFTVLGEAAKLTQKATCLPLLRTSPQLLKDVAKLINFITMYYLDKETALSVTYINKMMDPFLR